MAGVFEAIPESSPLGADLQAGVEAISAQQEIIFTRYVRLVLPFDGFVFWVKADLVTPSALCNVLGCGLPPIALNQSPMPIPARTLVAKGSLHYASTMHQDEVETFAINRIVFTSEQEVQDLNEVGPNAMWIAEIDGVRFAFSQRGSFYRQAQLWHYVGNAVYPDMETQVIDDLAQFDSRSLVVSNSLPAWLSLNSYVPLYGFGLPAVTLYPSFLLPQNIAPPFASVHVEPGATKAIAAAALVDRRGSSSQLAQDRVVITTHGLRNSDAILMVNAIVQWALDYEVVGIMNQPIVRDEKRTQPELGVIAMKKVVDFDVNYYQSRMDDVARGLITSALLGYHPT